MDKKLSKRREFLKSAFLKANGLLLSAESLADWGANSYFLPSFFSANGIVYENDFSSDLSGIVRHAVINLRIASGLLSFSTTNANRGIFVGPSYPQQGLQRWLVIKFNNPGNGIKLYTQHGNENSYVETITSTSEVVIPFYTASSSGDNRVFLSTMGPEYNISIDYIKIYDIDPGQSNDDLWVGTYQQTVNNRKYTWIPSRDANIEIQSNGNVVLTAPINKMSFNGINTCNRFVYDENYQHLGSSYLNNLFSSGVNLPDGHYHFLIHYFNSNSYESVDSDPWNLAANPNTFQSNSSAPEAISFSIETMSYSPPSNKVFAPVEQERVSWLITNQYLADQLHLPSGKDFGITRLHWDIVPNNTIASLNSVYTKVTHIQFAGRSELVPINGNQKWDCVMGTGMTPHQVADSQPSETNYIMMSQLKEQGHSNTSLEQAFQLTYQKLVNEKGISTPNQTKLYCDYFADTDGYGVGANFVHNVNSVTRKQQLSSQVEARKLYGLTEAPISSYFAQNCFNYRNRSAGGYLDSYQRISAGSMIFGHIFTYEKAFIAIDRNVICMSWSESEGVNSETTRAGVKYRLRLPSGDLIRRNVIGLPFELMKDQAFFSLLLGESYVLWANSENLVRNPANWDKNLFSSQIEFQPEENPIPLSWQEGNPSHPQPIESSVIVNSRQTHFPNSPLIGEQGAWCGAYLYGRISGHSDRVSESIRYAVYSFSINGGNTQNGYNGTNIPINGILGNAEVSRKGFSNAGQHNIVDLWEYKKPIVLVTKGAGGYSVIIKNVFCQPTDSVIYNVTVNGINRSIEHIGRTLGIYLFS